MRVPVTVISASGGATVPAGAGEASCACAGRFHSSATVSAVADTIDVDLDMYFPLFSISVRGEIGRAHVCTPVTNAHLVCRLLLDKNTTSTLLTTPTNTPKQQQ